MGGLQNSELLDFTGGMNTVTAPHLLAPNEALELTNVDIKFGSLKSITNLDNTASAQGKFFVEYRSKLYYYDDWRSNALVDDKLYWADGLSTGKIMPNGTELALGIDTPINAPTIDSSGNVGGGTHTGDFKYVYTFYSSTTGVESAPSPLTPYLSVSEQNIEVSALDALPPEADLYRIYRIGGFISRLTLVDTISAGELPYIDSLDYTQMDGRILQTLRTGTPPPGIKNFVELNGRLFGSVENKVYYSGLDAPDSWYGNDYFTMPDEVIGMAKVPAGLLVMGRAYVYALLGASPTAFRTKVVSSYLGCISNRSIAYYNDRVLWLGVDGIMASDGYNVQNLTYRKIERISDMNVNSAAVANDVYYLAFKPFRIPSEDLLPSNEVFPGGVRGAEINGSSEGIVALDFRRGNQFSYHYLEYLNALSLGIHRGELYLVLDGTKEPILCNQVFPCGVPFCYGEQILAKLGGTTADTYKTISYVSPQLTNGSLSTLKEYDKIRVNFVGKFDVTVIFSNLDVAVTSTIDSGVGITKEDDLVEEEDKVAVIGIPNAANKSYSIQFKVEGVGVVKSIQYSWKNRELP